MGEAVRTCQLCEAQRLTHRYYEDRVCWVADCRTCGIPMIVLKRHGDSLTHVEERHMLGVVCKLFPGCGVRTNQRRIKDHVHWHVVT